jgi:hypothetical protein
MSAMHSERTISCEMKRDERNDENKAHDGYDLHPSRHSGFNGHYHLSPIKTNFGE